MSVVQTPQLPTQRQPGYLPEAPPSAGPAAAEAPATETVYWGDRLALRVWVVCFLIMWALIVYNALTGLWGG